MLYRVRDYAKESAQNGFSHIRYVFGAVTEDKYNALIMLGALGVYVVTTIYYNNSMDELNDDMREYHTMLNQLSGGQVSWKALMDALSLAQKANFKFNTIALVQQLSRDLFEETFKSSLQRHLMRKWIGGEVNNQIGLKIMDPELANDMRDVLTNGVDGYVKYLVGTSFTIFDVVTSFSQISKTIAKVAALYAAGSLSPTFLACTALSCCVYLATQYALKTFIDRMEKDHIKSEKELEERLIFNAQNERMIDASNATQSEFKLLTESSKKVLFKFAVHLISHQLLNTVGELTKSLLELQMFKMTADKLIAKPDLYNQIKKTEKLVYKISYKFQALFSMLFEKSSLDLSFGKMRKMENSIQQFQAYIKANTALQFSRDGGVLAVENLTLYKPLTAEQIKAVLNNEEGHYQEELTHKISHRFVPGVITGLKGESGCGKTSFLNVISGVSPFAKGIVNGCSKSNIIYLTQGLLFKEKQDADAYIKWGYEEQFNKLDAQQQDELMNKVSELRKRMKIDRLETPGKGSGGQQQRFGILQALFRINLKRMLDKDALIVLQLDEAFSALDWKLKNTCVDLVKEEVMSNKITGLSVDHSGPKTLSRIYGSHVLDFDTIAKKSFVVAAA